MTGAVNQKIDEVCMPKYSKRHLVRVVEDCTPTTNVFDTKKETEAFLVKFNKKYKNMSLDGYWVDLVVYDISGDIIDDGVVLDEN